MRRIIFSVLVWSAAAVFTTDTLAQTQVILQDGLDGYSGTRDTKIKSDAPATNFGTALDIEIDGSPDYGALLYWDVSSIPSGSIISAVDISVNAFNPSSFEYEIYESKRAWTEGGATWQEYASGLSWQVAGGSGANDRASEVLGTLSAPSTGPRTASLNSAGVAVVQGWVDSPSSNLGFAVQDYADGTIDGMDFDTREVATVANRPSLTITYFPAGSNVPPAAAFSANPPGGNAPLDVSFDASASSDVDGTITSYDWDFGDGNFDSGVTTSHQYATPGLYTAELTVTDDDGDSDTATQNINVTTPGTIRFAVLGDFGDAGTPEAEVAAEVISWAPDFIITLGDNNYPDGEASTIDANIGQYYSDFIFPYSGSYGSTATMNRFFPSPGNHDWHTISCDGGTCTGAYFDYFTLPVVPADERYYEFVWGDVHFFSIDSDTGEPDGTSSSSTQALWLQSALAASTAPWKVVYFHHAAYSSSSNHGSTTRMQWPFAAWGADVVMGGHDHTYERIFRDGIVYYVNGLGGRSIYGLGTPISGSQVQYNGDYGAMRVDADASTMTIEFVTRTGALIDSYTLNKAVPMPPVADFSASPTSGEVPLAVDFTDLSSNVPTSWSWDFGDGGSSTAQDPSHIYNAAGTYTVSLTATNGDGSDVETKIDYIDVTEPASTVDHLAESQSIRYGTSSGGYADTHANGAGVLGLTEEESNGNPSKRRSQLEVTWTFNIRADLPATFLANAWNSPSSDGDDFRFSFSTDGSSFSPMFDLTEYSDGDVYQSFVLGPLAGTTLWIRLEDTDRTQGNRSLDEAFVDHMFVRTETSTDPPPDAPTLTATAVSSSQIDLSWTDVAIELGYRIERSDDGGSSYSEIDVVGADVTMYSDTGLPASTIFHYRAVAFNAGGSTNSNETSDTTFDPPAPVDVHLASLTGASSGSKKWTATATPLVHDASHATVAGVLATGTWTGDASGSGSCVTAATGACDVSTSMRPKDNSATFTVDNLGGAGFSYDSGANHAGGTSVVINAPGASKTTLADGREVPESLELSQNFPNPFNPVTVIEYGLPELGHVTVSVFNMLGVEVIRLQDGIQKAGWHEVRFDASGLSSGMYLAVVKSGPATLTRGMLLAK